VEDNLMTRNIFPAVLTAAALVAGIGAAHAQAGSSKAPDMTAAPGEYNTMPPVAHHKKHKPTTTETTPSQTTAPAAPTETKTPAPPDQTSTPPPDQTQAAPSPSESQAPPTPQNEPMPGQEPSPPPH